MATPTLLGGPTLNEAASWMWPITGISKPRTDGQHPGYCAHEAAPAVYHGWDWYGGAKPGPHIGAPFTGGSLNYHNVRAQVIPIEGGSPVIPGLRVQVDVPHVWHLVNGQWVDFTLAKPGHPVGGYWQNTPPFQNNRKFQTGDVRVESTGGWSFDLKPTLTRQGTVNSSTANVHWGWDGYNPRPHLNNSDQVAFFTRMRLISAGADVTPAKFVANFAGDLYVGANVGVDGSGVNPGIANPRFLKLTSQWRWVGYVSGTAAQISSYPLS